MHIGERERLRSTPHGAGVTCGGACVAGGPGHHRLARHLHPTTPEGVSGLMSAVLFSKSSMFSVKLQFVVISVLGVFSLAL